MSEQSQPPQHAGSAPAAPPVGVAWSPAMSAALFDPESWRESLEAYAHTTNLAVALVDVDRHWHGPCQNPQPTWRQLHAALGTAGEECPFALAPPRPCTCVRDALARRALVLRRDRTGLVHFTVPLVLDDHPIGALLAGQVFDQYPEQLRLEHAATRVELSPQEIWQVARLELPVKEVTLRMYGRLLAALGQAFLHTRYHTLMDAQRLAALEQRFQERTAALHHEVAERTAAEAQVQQAHTQLRALMAHLESLREAARTQLSRDLHDDLSQQLTGLHMNLAWMAQHLGTLRRSKTVTALLERVADSTALVQTLLGSMRDIAVDLRPTVLDRLGLGLARSEEAQRFQARTAIATAVCLPAPELSLTPEVATTLFRILQECLTNVARHAGATQVEIALTAEDSGVDAARAGQWPGYDGRREGQSRCARLTGYARTRGPRGWRGVLYARLRTRHHCHRASAPAR
jgi:signal transduction histidine kinase